MKRKSILIAILLSVFTTSEFFSQAEIENFTFQNVEVIEESTASATNNYSESESDENTIDENLQDDLVIHPENSELQENEIVMDSKNQNVDESVISSSNDEGVTDNGHGFWWWFFVIGVHIIALILTLIGLSGNVPFIIFGFALDLFVFLLWIW